MDKLLFDYDVDENIDYLSDDDIFEKYNVNLIDFGYTTSYIDPKSKGHIRKNSVDTFQGNIILSSVHQLKFMATSRRDDMVALFYLLIYLLRDGKMPGLE